MNSTRTCVTPPREPIIEWSVISCVCLKKVAVRNPRAFLLYLFVCLLFALHFLLLRVVGRGRGDEVVTLACAAEDSGHFDKLDGHF